MFDICLINSLKQSMLETVVSGYSSSYFYKVSKTEMGEGISFHLKRQELQNPFIKKPAPLDAATLQHYQQVVEEKLNLTGG